MKGDCERKSSIFNNEEFQKCLEFIEKILFLPGETLNQL